MDSIKNELFKLQDIEYRDFQIKLFPTLKLDTFIGVRTPNLKNYAKTLIRENDYEEFLNDLPHKYFDENQLHAFIISEIKDYNKCISLLNRFLPYVDNWATCDQMSPKVFKNNHDKLLEQIKIWIKSKDTYTIRFAINMLMKYFLDDEFKIDYLKMVSMIKSDEYYVKMMIAWFYATALAKRYDETISFLEEHKLDTWIHNKTIQKAIESYRISRDKKEYLKSLKIKIK